uniref:E3 ubiquitin-protein ligase TRIM39-like n=1 Tax=Sinocyclocheilus grahami TaxID=75366 RepID=A0A672KHX7_SINGR
MASSSGPLNEELKCSICLDVFTDPVTTPCGHNFCRTCLNKCWTSTQTWFCPFCKETFSRRPDLEINTTSEVVQHFKEKFNLGESEMLCDICDGRKQKMIQNRMKKIQEIQHSVELRKKEKSASVELFTDLIRSIERCQSELLLMMEEQQKAAEKQAEDLIKELQQEITDLKKRNTELEQISHTDDHLHVIQIFSSLYSRPHKNWTEIMDVTLDPDTVNPYLILSDDGKQVSLGDIEQDAPENPKRFDVGLCVLAKQGFSSGRFYYEVQVKGKTEWSLGVARESINRKEMITLAPEDGFWTVIVKNENQYIVFDNPVVMFSLRVKPEIVGVFVDYEEGLVSFYDVGSRSHIYSFTGQTFSDKLYPYFSPGLNEGGKNSKPLIITPVKIKKESIPLEYGK